MIRKRSSSVAINDERSSNPLPSTNPTGDRSAASASSAGSRSFSLSEPTSRTSIAASRVSSSANMSATSGAYPTRTAACASARPDCPAISTALRRGEVVLHIDGAVRPDGGDADEQSSGPRLFRDGGQRLSATAPAALEARGLVDHPHVPYAFLESHADRDQHRRPPRRSGLAPPGHRRVVRVGAGEAEHPFGGRHHRQGFRARRQDREG